MKTLFSLWLLLVTILFNINEIQAQITDFRGQEKDVKQKQLDKNKNYDVNIHVDSDEAHFQWGEDSLYKHIFYKLKYSDEAIAKRVKGTVTIAFDVNFDGKILNPYIVKGVGYGIDEALIDIFKNLTFVPAKMGGKIPYRSQVMLDINVFATKIEDYQKPKSYRQD